MCHKKLVSCHSVSSLATRVVVQFVWDLTCKCIFWISRNMCDQLLKFTKRPHPVPPPPFGVLCFQRFGGHNFCRICIKLVHRFVSWMTKHVKAHSKIPNGVSPHLPLRQIWFWWQICKSDKRNLFVLKKCSVIEVSKITAMNAWKTWKLV